jgi:hypothetical protein
MKPLGNTPLEPNLYLLFFDVVLFLCELWLELLMLARVILYVILFSPYLIACGHKADPMSISFYHRYDDHGIETEVSDYIDPRTEPFLPEKTNIVLAEVLSSDHSIANTRREPHGRYCEIEILQGAWDELSELRKRTLLYHELGHCLGQDHPDADKMLSSIMHPRLLRSMQLRILALDPPKETDWITQHFLELFGSSIIEQTETLCKIERLC